MLRLVSRFLRALFQFSKRAAGEATKFGRSGVELLGVVGATCLECGEPAAESGELIRRQLSDNFDDFFDFHGAQYSTGRGLVQRRKGIDRHPLPDSMVRILPPLSLSETKREHIGGVVRCVPKTLSALMR